MKLCRYKTGDEIAYAFVSGDSMVALADVMDHPLTDSDLFARLDEAVEAAKSAGNAKAAPIPAQLLPPIPPPEKIICIGLNYLDHAIETGAEPPTQPVVFSKFNTALVGHGDAIELPSISSEVDYEAELVVVIGKTARRVSVDSALSHVAGYTCGHDVSARDWQKGRPGGQWLLGKSFDTFAPLGPALVTADEIPDPSNLTVRMYLGDEKVQESTTQQLIFSIPYLIAHLSEIMTLKPGDVIFTGTPPGVGAARKPPRFLQSGDVCTVEIPKIGRLTNRCVS
jgi:2-keto-4-pentenoate hydratase/2-oxohepta-3-ene-1,7-dioic acid hydratase in catechol pathway